MLTLRRITNFKHKIPCFNFHPLLIHTANTGPQSRVTSAYYDDLVNEAGRSKDFEMIHYLLNKRHKDRCFNTNDTFKFITEMPASRASLDELFETIARLPKGIPRKNACDSLIARICKLQLVDDALKVLKKMQERGFELNVCTFHPILNVMTRKKELQKAWHMLDVMKEAGASPDTTSYNYLLTSYCLSGDVAAAADLLLTMREAGLVGDARTYDAMVLGACKAGKLDGAMVLLKAALDDGMPLLYSTHAHVINGLLKKGYYEQVLKFVIGCGGRDKKLDTESFGVLASRLINLERLHDAKLVLDEMNSRGLLMGEKLRDFYKLHL